MIHDCDQIVAKRPPRQPESLKTETADRCCLTSYCMLRYEFDAAFFGIAEPYTARFSWIFIRDYKLRLLMSLGWFRGYWFRRSDQVWDVGGFSGLK